MREKIIQNQNMIAVSVHRSQNILFQPENTGLYLNLKADICRDRLLAWMFSDRL